MIGAVTSKRGRWVQTLTCDGYSARRPRARVRYYWRGVRVPWLAWAMFAPGPDRDEVVVDTETMTS